MRAPSSAERAAWADALGDSALHDRLLSGLACLHETEVGLPPAAPEPAMAPVLDGWVRIAAWNVQRGRRPGAVAAALRHCRAHVFLVSELDAGMARSANADVTAEVAGALGTGYAFGVEFVELGPGDAEERARVGDVANARGLHGNAILSAAALRDPAVVRLPGPGAVWFGARSPQPRVGGRMAVVATVVMGGVPVTVASTHLENRADPEERAAQMAALLRAVDERAGAHGPAVVGGDLNTLGGRTEALSDRALVGAVRAAEPAHFTWPVAHEPLFEVAAAHGYEWVDANVAAPTTEHDAVGLPDHVPLKLDWFLVRGVTARRPAVVPVGDLSDHRIVTVAVRYSASAPAPASSSGGG